MTDGWTTLPLPMVNASTLCLCLKARCFFALLFVARMANNNPHKSNQGGTVILKRKRKIICLTNTRTTHISRLRKGIGLVIKPGEAESCSILATWGLIVRAYVSEEIITRAVTSRKNKKIASNNLATLFSSNNLSVKRYSLMWWSPGLIMWAKTRRRPA